MSGHFIHIGMIVELWCLFLSIYRYQISLYKGALVRRLITVCHFFIGTGVFHNAAPTGSVFEEIVGLLKSI